MWTGTESIPAKVRANVFNNEPSAQEPISMRRFRNTSPLLRLGEGLSRERNKANPRTKENRASQGSPTDAKK